MYCKCKDKDKEPTRSDKEPTRERVRGENNNTFFIK